MNPTDFATVMMASLRVPLERALKQMHSELAASIEAKVAALPTPKDGKSVTVEEVARAVSAQRVEPTELAALVREEVARQVAEIKVPEPAAPPSVDEIRESLVPEVRELVSTAVGEIPAPKDGTSVTLEDVRPLVRELVAQGFEALPPAKDGRDADPAETELIVRRLLDQLPRPRDGRDGIGTREEIALAVREAVAAVVPEQVESAVSEMVKSVPRMEYRGVWSEGLGVCRKGDAVTFGGSLWICRAEETTDKPGTSPAWQLAVKKGRDGRDATR